MKRKRGVKCQLCPYTSRFPSYLKRHLASIHNIGVTWYQCHMCDSKFKDKSNFKRHLASIHYIGVTWHQCHLCDYKGKRKSHLTKHLLYKHDIGVVSWHQCHLCDYKTKVSKFILKRHMAEKHDVGVTWHKCHLCDVKRKSKGNLRQHLADVHNVGVNWYQCDHCTYKCKRKSNMISHLACKHDIGNKYCDICYEIVGKTRSIKGADVCRTCCDDYGFRKERIELKYIKALQKRFPYHMEHDTRVQGDMCLRYRPDAMWLDPHLKCHIQFELDEHQHLWKNGSYDCDEKRISDIYDEFKSNVPEHFVVVRLNPDSELGRAAVFKDRLNHLVEVLERVKTSPPKEKISIIYMYYDKNNHRIAKNLPKYLLDKDNKII